MNVVPAKAGTAGGLRRDAEQSSSGPRLRGDDDLTQLSTPFAFPHARAAV